MRIMFVVIFVFIYVHSCTYRNLQFDSSCIVVKMIQFECTYNYCELMSSN